jgi:integrase
VHRQVKRIPGKGWTFDTPKTNAGVRTIKLDPWILPILKQHKNRQDLEMLVACEAWEDYDLIFPTSIGTPLHQTTLRRDFLKILKRTGLPKIRFHDLRHTAATLMLNNRIPAIVVSKRLGHSKTSTTLDTYGHLIHTIQDEAAEVMGDLLPIKIDLELLGAQGLNKDSNQGQNPQ